MNWFFFAFLLSWVLACGCGVDRAPRLGADAGEGFDSSDAALPEQVSGPKPRRPRLPFEDATTPSPDAGGAPDASQEPDTGLAGQGGGGAGGSAGTGALGGSGGVGGGLAGVGGLGGQGGTGGAPVCQLALCPLGTPFVDVPCCRPDGACGLRPEFDQTAACL